ncbi:hypothetical protein QTP70_006148 [Hemibagrus guttatus]|uniref:Integrase zinc-binding domain-containing protein n=1 Tax=Hemibagrus guttatus TaxID=175788 RepID=A0AAE0R3Z1_9TELE|nr:hypothetical protein QTP70_006148 [Hemibagrus guttatus]
MHSVPAEVRPVFGLGDELITEDNIILKGNRALIPKSLQPEYLKILHKGHPGVEATKRRARESMFWPSVSDDIEASVKTCSTCNCLINKKSQSDYMQFLNCLVPKTEHPRELNHFRPVALTSLLMKTMERIIFCQLRSLVCTVRDPLQFAYRPDIGVDDAVIYLMHWALTHLESTGSTKFSDDSAIVGCVSDGNEQEYRDIIKDFVDWLTIQGLDIELVDKFKYLGVHLNNRLDWLDNTDALYKKGQSRLYLQRRLGSFGVSKTLLRTFYDTVVASAILCAIVCWVGGSTERDRKRLNKLVRRASSVLGCPLDLVEEVGERRMLAKLRIIMNNTSHPQCRKERYRRMSMCNLTEKSCRALSSVLSSKYTSLRELDLSMNNLQDSGVKLLSDGLKNPHCTLELLWLCKCNLTEESCAVLSSVLSSNSSSLKDLNLSGNKLYDSGVKKLSEGLKDPNCKLEILWLEWCSITDEGIVALVSALRSNASSQLKELDLNGNKPGNSGVTQLKDLLQDRDSKLETLEYHGFCSGLSVSGGHFILDDGSSAETQSQQN